MDISTIIIICAAIFGLVWIFPKLPQIGQWVVAVVVVIACLIILLKYAGVPISL
jgi:hypothetical protein